MTVNNRLASIAVLMAATVAAATPAAAQCATGSCRATNDVRVRVGTVMRLTLQGSTTVLASPTPAAYAAGHEAVSGPLATVKSNGRWTLQISAGQEAWTAEGAGARQGKPASDLEWSGAAAGDVYTGLSTAPSDVAAGGATNGVTLPIQYRARFTQASDMQGTYTMVVKLTLVGA